MNSTNVNEGTIRLKAPNGSSDNRSNFNLSMTGSHGLEVSKKKLRIVFINFDKFQLELLIKEFRRKFLVETKKSIIIQQVHNVSVGHRSPIANNIYTLG